ncbi:hypothetical protein RvY_02401 [Ramazzottius varieornatus]|uniref:Uncharacterized protein n=1 Tax=Ramazzottius varieornatus TaxID=947166 RepID=A0A1D1UJM3_RAMVA|nr:hypothetical protein RvY_02401 [Ramazzottius varieornatus]
MEIRRQQNAVVAIVTIVTYILFPTAFLSSIQFAGPGTVDMGVEFRPSQLVAVANVTIVTYVLYPTAFLTSIQFTGPALDMGVERLRNEYHFNVTHRYVGSYNWSTIQGMVENLYLVAKFYYNEWDGNGLFALISSGL